MESSFKQPLSDGCSKILSSASTSGRALCASKVTTVITIIIIINSNNNSSSSNNNNNRSSRCNSSISK